MKKLLSKIINLKKVPRIFSVPEHTRVYCIGDIHGRYDLLIALHNKIVLDSEGFSGKKLLIYLGDYIDRGLYSKEVVDLLLTQPVEGFEAIYLRGNHEQVLLDFLNLDPNIASQWFNFGGLATVFSYGLAIKGIPVGDDLKQIQQDLINKIPTEHISFYSHLQHSFEYGDYFFVHAGVKPKVALSHQSKLDMMWIREEFLNSKFCHPKMIVHGHSVSKLPIVLSNRIGIDTGAYYSDILTCLILEGENKRFLATS